MRTARYRLEVNSIARGTPSFWRARVRALSLVAGVCGPPSLWTPLPSARTHEHNCKSFAPVVIAISCVVSSRGRLSAGPPATSRGTLSGLGLAFGHFHVHNGRSRARSPSHRRGHARCFFVGRSTCSRTRLGYSEHKEHGER